MESPIDGPQCFEDCAKGNLAASYFPTGCSRNNGTDGTSGKGGSMGSVVGVGASVSTSVTGIGWRRIGVLPDTTRRT
jgi:hypothetical protein